MLRENPWIKRYQDRGAYWQHDGNMSRPHALLTKGGHSDGYVKSEFVLEDPALLGQACSDLLMSLRLSDAAFLYKVQRVVGPAMGAITIAHDVARQISEKFSHQCLRAYVEKETYGMSFKRTNIKDGEEILLVEDVLTTGGSIENTVDAVVEAGGNLIPYVGVLVNRSGLTTVRGMKIISLITTTMKIWTPKECPFCKNGSEAIRPKEGDNWDCLTAKY